MLAQMYSTAILLVVFLLFLSIMAWLYHLELEKHRKLSKKIKEHIDELNKTFKGK